MAPAPLQGQNWKEATQKYFTQLQKKKIILQFENMNNQNEITK